jgi:hypothetical protein
MSDERIVFALVALRSTWFSEDGPSIGLRAKAHRTVHASLTSIALPKTMMDVGTVARVWVRLKNDQPQDISRRPDDRRSVERAGPRAHCAIPVPRPVCTTAAEAAIGLGDKRARHRFCLKTIEMYKATLQAWPTISQKHAEHCADETLYPDLEQCVLDPLVEE